MISLVGLVGLHQLGTRVLIDWHLSTPLRESGIRFIEFSRSLRLVAETRLEIDCNEFRRAGDSFLCVSGKDLWDFS